VKAFISSSAKSGLYAGRNGRKRCTLLLLVGALFCTSATMHGEDGSEAWLRYRALPAHERPTLPTRVVLLSHDAVTANAAKELTYGLTRIEGSAVSIEQVWKNVPSILIGTRADVDRALGRPISLPPGTESFRVERIKYHGTPYVLITAASPSAAVFAVFRLLERIETGKDISIADAPDAPIRWTDEWDNMNGTIERGYAGRSFFFANGHVLSDLTRASAYARLLASVGINGCNVNNVNADLDLLTAEHLQEFARLAKAFRPWGVRLALSVDLSSPKTVGGLDTFDPLDPGVIAWWKKKIDDIYRDIPDFAGFTVKADSEGRAGPSQYGRSPADAANVLARALRPHGGVVLYRGFVYNHHLDWQDRKADRARAGYDNFAKFDGTFEPNVIVQIKHGPIDFQAREPVSPLFGALHHTAQAIELQTAQEYTGQQRHMVFLPTMWKWVLDTDLRVEGKPSTVADIVTGRRFVQHYGGFVSVVNAGSDANWLHHPMAMANLFGFGKLAWHPSQPLDEALDTWTRLTWGDDPQVVHTVTAMLSDSWRTYEGYTGPNGMGTLTNILGVHFGPGIESAERNGWGQWFRGEKDGVGMDRTNASGTGFIGQYPPEFAAKFETLSACPDDLLLFFHHVPYTYLLHSGKTLVQSVYDTHYASAARAAQYVADWESLQAKIDPERFSTVQNLLVFQAGHALLWRDAINIWFLRISGIADEQGRVSHDPNRYEAEAMEVTGYVQVDIKPFETASNGKAVVCPIASGCSLRTSIRQNDGTYNIAVQYFDLRTGISRYTLKLNGKPIASWAADAILPPAVVRTELDGQTATRYTIRSVPLHHGDTLELIGVPDLNVHEASSEDPAGTSSAHASTDRRELAPVDYIELGPGGAITPQ